MSEISILKWQKKKKILLKCFPRFFLKITYSSSPRMPWCNKFAPQIVINDKKWSYGRKKKEKETKPYRKNNGFTKSVEFFIREIVYAVRKGARRRALTVHF